MVKIREEIARNGINSLNLYGPLDGNINTNHDEDNQ